MDGDGAVPALHQLQEETGHNTFTATQAANQRWEVSLEIPMIVSGVTHASEAQEALLCAAELPSRVKDLMLQPTVAQLLGLQADTLSVRVLNKDQVYRAMALLRQHDEEAAAVEQQLAEEQDAGAAGAGQGLPATPAAAVRRSASPAGLTAPTPATDTAALAAVEAPATSPRRSARLRQQQVEAGEQRQLSGARSADLGQLDSQQQQEGEGEQDLSGGEPQGPQRLSAPSGAAAAATEQQLQASAARRRRSELLLHRHQLESALRSALESQQPQVGTAAGRIQQEQQQQEQETPQRRRRGLRPPTPDPDLPADVLNNLPFILLATWDLSEADARVQILADAAAQAAAAAAAGRIAAAAAAAAQQKETAAREKLAATLAFLTEALQPFSDLDEQHRATVTRLMVTVYNDYGPTKQTINDHKKRQRLL